MAGHGTVAILLVIFGAGMGLTGFSHPLLLVLLRERPMSRQHHPIPTFTARQAFGGMKQAPIQRPFSLANRTVMALTSYAHKWEHWSYTT